MARPSLRIALAEINPHLGDLGRNAGLIRAARAAAARDLADVVVVPALALTGDPLHGLAQDAGFLDACEAAIAELAADRGPALILGAPWRDGAALRNAAWVLDEGRVVTRRAQHRPQPGFDPGPVPGPVALRGHRLGVMLGTDAWDGEVAETLAESGAELLLALTAQPFERSGPEARIDRAVARVVETGLALACVNLLGGEEDRVFDGAGFVLNPDRSLAVQLPGFAPALCVTEWHRQGDALACAPQPLPPPMTEEERIWRAMMLGLADAVAKGRFHGVTLDLPGTIGGAISAAVAVDALGAHRVRAVFANLPIGRGDDEGAARTCATALGIAQDDALLRGALLALRDHLGAAADHDTDREGRLAALVVADMAPTAGHLLLSAIDKPGMALGEAQPWCHYSVVQDAFPSLLRRLGRWRNATRPAGARGPAGPCIPEGLFATPDADRAPAWPARAVLEPILEALLERRESPAALVAAGHDPRALQDAIHVLRHGEGARRTAPPGLILSASAFGPHWRYPVRHGFREPFPGTGPDAA